jgi:hypothetical protein
VFTLDGKDREMFKMRVVRAELENVGAVIGKFARWCGSGQGEKGTVIEEDREVVGAAVCLVRKKVYGDRGTISCIVKYAEEYKWSITWLEFNWVVVDFKSVRLALSTSLFVKAGWPHVHLHDLAVVHQQRQLLSPLKPALGLSSVAKAYLTFALKLPSR